ncbi:hypothetical protein [Vibrio crassostreae]|uniref:hypothetical protein n=1 Tax=Vibrio crassostreae TaxID=246167 RepID=UPI001B30CB01|nr:hypothetical protein [Vibrio crassostreae]
MNTLNITPENKIDNWANVIRTKLESGDNLLIIGDTETTGTHELGDKKNFGRKDRILEIGFLFYEECEKDVVKPLLDMEGQQIFFHEYINPHEEDPITLERYNSIMEIPDEVIKFVHGIDHEFLKGKAGLVKKGGGRDSFILPQPAPTFEEVKPYLEDLLCVDDLVTFKGKLKFIAHNALFDVQFMNAEWKKTEMYEEKRQFPAFFESYIETVDTLKIASQMYTRAELKEIGSQRGLKASGGFSLDFLQEFYEIEAARDMHGALLDSEILAMVYKALVTDERYQTSSVISKTKQPTNKIERKTRSNLVAI